jgi:hypothetical protein
MLLCSIAYFIQLQCHHTLSKYLFFDGEFMKKIILLFVLLPFQIFAQSEECFLRQNGEIISYLCGQGPDCYQSGRPVELEVSIPETLDGKAITSIADYAFSFCSIKSVKLSNNLKKIGRQSFAYNRITSLVVPRQIKTFGREAFSDNFMRSVEFLPGRKEISGEMSFAHNLLDTVIIPEGVVRINGGVFIHNDIINIIFPSTLESIGGGAFMENLITDLKLPAAIDQLDGCAFCNNPIKEVSIPSKVLLEDDWFYQDGPLSLNFSPFYYNNSSLGGTYVLTSQGWVFL